VRRRPTGFGGRAPDAAAILQIFLKKYAFLGIFLSKFLLKNAFFKSLNKLCSCTSKNCAPGRVSPLAPPPPFHPCYTTERDHFKILNAWFRQGGEFFSSPPLLDLGLATALYINRPLNIPYFITISRQPILGTLIRYLIIKGFYLFD